MSDKRHAGKFITSSKEGGYTMLAHHIRPATAVADALQHRNASVAPGKEPGSRTEFSSDKNAADIHVHAYASVRSTARAGGRRGARRFAAAHDN